ncbi:MAG: cytochrome P450 [Rhizobiaceae bacterium]
MAVCPPYLTFDPATRRLRLDPHEPRFVQEPYEAYTWLHTASPVFFWEDYGFWCFGGHDAVNRLLRDRRIGRQPPEPPTGDRSHMKTFDALDATSMIELEPPVHTRLRTLVNRAFVSRQVERLRPRVTALANELIDQIEPDHAADLLPAFATPIPITVIAEMLGVPVEAGPQLVEWSHRMVAMYMHGRSRQTEIDANAAAQSFSAFVREHARARKSAPGDDLLTLLLSAHEDGQKLSEDELVSSVILLLNAGHEATVHQTGNAVRTILHSGLATSGLFHDAEATSTTVEECLRFDPPLHMFTRFAYAETDLGDGVLVKRGEQIGLLLGMANRDPLAFQEPDTFMPGRPDQKNVSFGAGIHFCIGAPLARIELQEGLRTLFERLPCLQLADVPAYRDAYHFHGLKRLDCTW